MSQLFAQVILPLSLHNAYTYIVPVRLVNEIAPGKRVIVQFGARRYYAALVISISRESSVNLNGLKEVQQVLDEHPIVFQQNLDLWKWIASYYCCTLGDVFRAALPAGLKLESKSGIFLTNSEEEVLLSEKEREMLCQVENGANILSQLELKLGRNFSFSTLKSLIGKKLVYVEEKINKKYRPKMESYVKFSSLISSEKELNAKMESLKRAKKQEALLLHFCTLVHAFDRDAKSDIPKKDLLAGTNFSSAILKGVVEKGILIDFQKPVSRLEEESSQQVDINLLNRFQSKALDEIKQVFETKSVVLIHGITASGKTEIYIHLIDEVIKAGKQVLYLVPEIALTTQIIRRLKNVFGGKVGIYHSKLNSQERVEIWKKTLLFHENPDKGFQVILGARSAIFLPFSELGLLIVDEEHENSYKQFDPAPRYNARDMAVVLGMQNNAKVLLGSATPSYESYRNALLGKYGLVTLNKRHSEVELPEIIVADLKRAYKRKEMHSVLTRQLYELVVEALDKNEQVILFQNRRGFSPYVECFSCGHIPKCTRCDVSLTYHKYKKRLICHYCGYSIPLPDKCDECGSPEIKTRGFGTEKVEDELKKLFRNARIDRMDLDTTRSKNAFEKIVKKLESGRTDILIGTQMVTKGLDFEQVNVVGVLNADNLLNFPDFRAYERAYQLISQVAGRAGRAHKRGKVVIQTSQPDHPLIELIRKQDYLQTMKLQLEERQLFKYPPFYRLVKIIVKHKNSDTVERVAGLLAGELRKDQSLIVLGPEFPLINRIQFWYQKEIWVKLSKKLNPVHAKQYIVDTVATVKKAPANSNCQINIDVDPY